MKLFIQIYDRYVNRLLKIVSVFLLCLMSVVVFAQVVFRFFHASILWSEEVSIYSLVWCVFLGAALCCRKGTLVGLEAVKMLLPKPARKFVAVLACLCSVVFLLTIAYVGVNTSIKVWSQTTPILGVPVGLIYFAIPLGSVFMAVNTLISTYESLEGLKE